MPDRPGFRTIGDLVGSARQVVGEDLWAWAASGAGEGATVARNRAALDRLGLVSRLGVDVSSVRMSTEVAGVAMSMPVFLAPVGVLDLFDPEGAVTAARAAAQAGTFAMCSTLAIEPWEEVAATAPGTHSFQVYVLGDASWQTDLVARVVEAGFGSICVTMDTPRTARRDWAVSAGVDLAARGGNPNLGAGWDRSHRASFTWADLERICATATVPVVAKGVLTPEDAVAAVESGASVVYVSNHGGRVIDHEVSGIEVLSDVAEAVAGRAEVVVDGGFLGGADVCKALALGAYAVGLGRLQCWALAVAGAEGVGALLEIVRIEIHDTMANLGCPGIADLTLDRVHWSIPSGLDRP